MHKKFKELATRHAILIVHKDYDKVAKLSLFFRRAWLSLPLRKIWFGSI